MTDGTKPSTTSTGLPGRNRRLLHAAVTVLLATAAVLSAVALAHPTSWRELNTGIATTPGVTFVGLRVGPSQLCLHNRLTTSATAIATTEPSIEGDFCYALRTMESVRLLANVNASTVTITTLDICDRMTVMSSYELLAKMGVPSKLLFDVSNLVDFACSPTPLALHIAAVTAAGFAVVGFLVAYWFTSKQKSLELTSTTCTVVSAALIVVELVLWNKASSLGSNGSSIYLCFAALATLVVALLVQSQKKKQAEHAGEDEVSPRATETLV